MSPPAANVPNRRQHDAQVVELKGRVDATDDLVAEHESKLDMMFVHHRTVAQQIADLDSKIDGRIDELERRMPSLIAETARQMVRDPEEWAAAIAAAREGLAKVSSQAAGNAVMRLFKGLAAGSFKFLAMLALLYYTGGLKAVLAFITLKGPGS